MTINPTSNIDYNAMKAKTEQYAKDQADRIAFGINSTKAVDAVKGIDNRKFLQTIEPVEAVQPVSYADTDNVDTSVSTANLGNLTPAMEKLMNPAPTPTSSSPTESQQTAAQQTATQPQTDPAQNDYDFDSAEALREQVRAMRNTRPPESGQSISAARREEVSQPNPADEIKEKFGVGSTEGQSESTKVLNRVA